MAGVVMMLSPKYIADCHNVREVTIRGTADLRFWTRELERQNLKPSTQDGKAQILIIAGQMRYMGIEFTEVSFSIVVTAAEMEAGRKAVFLAQAFNSSRLFTFCERTLFATPYSHADCRLSTALPASVQVNASGEVVFRAEIVGDDREQLPAAAGNVLDDWEGAIFLPAKSESQGSRYVYFARLFGPARIYPFDPTRDAFTIRPTKDAAVLQSLADTDFVPTEWLIRDNATHSRSKTYRRAKQH